jgi:hypothetical protein
MVGCEGKDGLYAATSVLGIDLIQSDFPSQCGDHGHGRCQSDEGACK